MSDLTLDSSKEFITNESVRQAVLNGNITYTVTPMRVTWGLSKVIKGPDGYKDKDLSVYLGDDKKPDETAKQLSDRVFSLALSEMKERLKELKA
jgi:hypothetical protein